LDDSVTCGASAHAASKFEPRQDAFYVRETSGRALIAPAFPSSDLEDYQISILLQRSLSVNDWSSLFVDIESDQLPDWLQVEDKENSAVSKLAPRPKIPVLQHITEQVQSPISSQKKAGIIITVPMLSFDEDEFNLELDSSDAETSSVFQHTLKNINARFIKLRDEWARAFQEVEANYMVMASDLGKLEEGINSLSAAVGDAAEAGEPTAGSVWDSIILMQKAIKTLPDSMHRPLQLMQAKLQAVQTEVKDLGGIMIALPTDAEYEVMEDRMSKVETQLHRCDVKFAQVLAFCHRLQTGQPAPSLGPVTNVDDLQTQIRALQLEWQAFQRTPVAHPSSSALEEQLRDVTGQLKILQQRILGSGVQIGSRVFQSFDDVKVWIKSQLPSRRYGLFVDAVSLLDFISASHYSDVDKTFTAFHNQQKTGFVSMYEARVAVSTQNLFPTVFGRTNSLGLDDSKFLPALPSPDKWDSGSTGLRYQINKSLVDVTLQVESAINSILDLHIKARQLAMECLIESERFISELSHFILQDYAQWLHRGHSKKEAWKITSVCVQRVFESLHSERIVAKDILDQSDADFSTAKYLWATWKAHPIYKDFQSGEAVREVC